MGDVLSAFASSVSNIVNAGDAQAFVALFLVAALTEFGIPFPLVLDSLLFILGYQILDSVPKAALVMAVLLLGRVAGSSGVYWLAYLLGGTIIKWLSKRFPSLSARMSKFARKLGMKDSLPVALSRMGIQTSLVAAATTFSFRTPLAVAMARLTPGLLTVTSVASGILRLRYRYFVLGIVMSSVFYDVLTIALGAITGYGLRQFNITLSSWSTIVGVAVDIVVVLVIMRFIRRRMAKKTAQKESR